MSTFQSFEEIEAWQKARELTRQVYALSKSGSFAKDYGLRDQVCRACVSVMANIAEGFERGGRREFIQFLSTAKASAGEVRSHLFVALDQAYVTPETYDKLVNDAKEVSRMIAGLMKYLHSSEIKGPKYKGIE
jgi:four helix bundle protein